MNGARAVNQVAENPERVDGCVVSSEEPEISDAAHPRRFLHEAQRLGNGEQVFGIVEHGTREVRARKELLDGRADAPEKGDDGYQPSYADERDGLRPGT